MKKVRYTVSILGIVTLLGICVSNNVFAAGWIGTGGNQPSGGGGGGGSGSCSSTQNTYTQNCAGKSWLYFKYTGGSSMKGLSLSWRNVTSSGSDYFDEIPSSCTEAGGFWQYGINGQMVTNHYGSYYRMPISNGAAYGIASTDYSYYSPTKNTWGHWHISSPNKLTYGDEKIPGTPKHYVMKKNYGKMYEATKFALTSDDTLWDNFKTAYKYYNNTTDNPTKSDLKNAWAFCYGDGINDPPKVSEYNGSVSIRAESTDGENQGQYVDSATSDPGDAQTLTVYGNTYKLTFTDIVERTDDGNFNANNEWEITSTNTGSTNGNAIPTGDSGTVTTKAAKNYKVPSGERSFSGTIFAGQTITYCETLSYDKKVTQTSSTRTTTRKTAKACIKVKKAAGVCSNLQGDLEGKIYSYNEGQNWGQIGVRNKSLSNDFTLVNGGVGSIYAKPGDEVRFRYNYCAGGVYARALGGGDTVNGVSYRPSSNSSGAVSQRLISNYLFEDSVSTFEGDDFNGSTTAKTFSFDGITASNMADNASKIDKRYHSPGRSARYRSCNTTIVDNNTSDEHYYKVVGKGPFAADGSLDGCYNRTRTLDVGHTFSQTLTWNDYGLVNGNKYNNGDTSATAEVKVPYNYTLAPYVSNESNNPGRVAYVGEEINMTPGVVVQGRKNLVFPEGDNEYATITKPTELRVKYYYKTSGGSIISEASSSSSRSGFRLNANGLLDGTTDNESQKSINDGGTKLDGVNVKIPTSVNVGDQVCVELSVYPADSHDVRSASVVNGEGIAGLMEGSTLDINNPANWATAISCSTIAKKPTMSVESSNAYSATKFKTAQYARYNGDARRINFGSWSEYGVYGRVDLTAGTGSLFASGAALGYSRDGYPNALGVNAPRTNDTASADANKISTKSNSDKCTFMTQTFANSSCETGSANIGGVSARQYSERIKERYSGGSEVFEVQGLPTRNIAGTTYYDVSGYNSADVIMAESGVVRFHATNNLYVNALPNLSNDQFAEKGVTKPNPTIVYDAPGKNIVIDGNLGYDGGAKSTIDSLAQVIIVAKNVYFTDAPTYINAIIVADNVNTCKYSGGENVSVGGVGGAVTLTNTRCSQALQFDAPVVTKKIVLNRTAGAGSGDDSIKRAEIFNLNMANYLWSFNQMSRLSQAVTTYAREMPTRY